MPIASVIAVVCTILYVLFSYVLSARDRGRFSVRRREAFVSIRHLE